jgi:hypothetical protein
MAKGAYIGVDGVARKVKQPYIGVDNVARKVKKAYIGVDNVARECMSGGTPVGDLPVGASVYMAVNGVPTEFLIIHQGLPRSADYDSSCDGTWLLTKNIYAVNKFGSSNDYVSSNHHKYLNDTFINLLDGNLAGIIKQVIIPYTKGMGLMGTYYTGSSGLSVKAFLLSRGEVMYQDDAASKNEGFILDYFYGADNDKRKAYFNGSAKAWLLRSPNTDEAMYQWGISDTGSADAWRHCGSEAGVRPAVIIPRDAMIDGNFNIIA